MKTLKSGILTALIFILSSNMLCTAQTNANNSDTQKREKEIRASLAEIDQLFKEDFYQWLASLYDPKTGGFYYMNSSKADPTKYPPTIESTAQAIGIIRSLVETPLPDDIKKKLVQFVNERQDSATGYFVDIHPDPTAQSDPSFQARAYMYGQGILKSCGGEPKYPYPSSRNVKTSAIEFNPATLRQEMLAVTRCYRVAPQPVVSSTVENDVLAQKYNMRTKEDIIQWLDNLPWQLAWTAGQRIADIAVYLKDLSPERRQLFLDTAWDYLAKKQDPITGYWGGANGYCGLSNVMKIKTIYFPFNKAVPNMSKICVSMLKTMKEEEPSAFMQVRNAIDNMSTFISSAEPGEKQIIQNMIPEALSISAQILKAYKRPDGGFSYGKNKATAVSQRVKVGGGLDEGDILGAEGVRAFRAYAWNLAALPYQKPDSVYSRNFFERMRNNK